MAAEDIVNKFHGPDRALFCLSKSNPFRRICIILHHQKWFHSVILLCVLLNIILLALHDPLKPDDPQTALFSTIDNYLTIVFTIEMVVAITSNGFVSSRHSYLRSGWNVLDFTLVIVGWLSFTSLDKLSGLRSLRLLRPLRAIARISEMRILVRTLFSALPQLFKVFGLFLFLLTIFSVVGMNVFSGVLRQRCVDDFTGDILEPDRICTPDPTITTARQCPPNHTCLPIGQNMKYGFISFDDMGSTLLLVFRQVSMDSWAEVITTLSDGLGPYVSWYFIILTILGTYVILNLALVTVNETFQKNVKKEKARAAYEKRKAVLQADRRLLKLDHHQKLKRNEKNVKLLRTQSRMSSSNSEDKLDPKKRLDRWRLRCQAIAASPIFTNTVTSLIIANFVAMATQSYPMPPERAAILVDIDTAMTALFSFELLIKLFAYGKRFFKDRFNTFDFLVVLLSIVDQTIDDNSLIVFKALRLLRLFKLSRAWSGLRRMLEIVVESVKAVAYVGLLVALVLFIYALVGMQFFAGQTTCEDPTSTTCRLNFDSLFNSMLTVFSVLTGEGWSEIMYQIMREAIWAPLFFVSLFIISNHLFLNVFVAILLSKFSEHSVSLKRQTTSASLNHSTANMITNASSASNASGGAAGGANGFSTVSTVANGGDFFQPTNRFSTATVTENQEEIPIRSKTSFVENFKMRSFSEAVGVVLQVLKKRKEQKEEYDRQRRESKVRTFSTTSLDVENKSQLQTPRPSLRTTPRANSRRASVTWAIPGESVFHVESSPQKIENENNDLVLLAQKLENKNKNENSENSENSFVVIESNGEVVIGARTSSREPSPSSQTLIRRKTSPSTSPSPDPIPSITTTFPTPPIASNSHHNQAHHRMHLDEIPENTLFANFRFPLVIPDSPAHSAPPLLPPIVLVSSSRGENNNLLLPAISPSVSRSESQQSMLLTPCLTPRSGSFDSNSNSNSSQLPPQLSYVLHMGEEISNSHTTSEIQIDDLPLPILEKSSLPLVPQPPPPENNSGETNPGGVESGSKSGGAQFRRKMLRQKLAKIPPKKEEVASGEQLPKIEVSPTPPKPEIETPKSFTVRKHLPPVHQSPVKPRFDSDQPNHSARKNSNSHIVTDFDLNNPERGLDFLICRNIKAAEQIEKEQKRVGLDLVGRILREHESPIVFTITGHETSDDWVDEDQQEASPDTERTQSVVFKTTLDFHRPPKLSLFEEENTNIPTRQNNTIFPPLATAPNSFTIPPLTTANKNSENPIMEDPVFFMPQISSKFSGAAMGARPVLMNKVAPQQAGQLPTTGFGVAGDSLLSATKAAKVSSKKTLFLFSENSIIRKSANKITKNKYFESAVVFFIVLSCVGIALDSPESRNDPVISEVMRVIEYVSCIVFTAESALQLIARGLLFDKEAVLRSPWGILDMTIVITSNIALFGESFSGAAIRSLRVLRALRPLRLIKRNPQLVIIVDSLIASIPSIRDVLLVAMLLFFIFAVVGVELFAGGLQVCSDSSITIPNECVGTFIGSNGQLDTRQWEAQPSNFDNVPQAIITLFRLVTQDNWQDVMFAAIDSKGPETEASYNANPSAALFFVLWLLIGSMFLMNLFVGVLLDQFESQQTERKATDDRAELWKKIMPMLLVRTPMKLPPRPKKQPLRAFFDLAFSDRFDGVIFVAIVLNTIALTFPHYGQSEAWTEGLHTINVFFTALFVFEAVVKIIGMGPRMYFRSMWNKFDFAVAVVGFTGLFASYGNVASVFRVLRVARVVRIARQVRGLRQLIKTMIQAIPSLSNIFGLVLLNFFTFAALGVQLFGKLRHGENINSQNNFENLSNAFFVLFRVMVGDSWTYLMSDCSIQPPQCDEALGDCGQPFIAPLFFCCFILMSTFVLINLVIAVVLNQFQHIIDAEAIPITENDVIKFVSVWKKYDKFGSYFIRGELVPSFLSQVGPPLGIGKKSKIAPIMTTFREARVRDFHGLVFYGDLIKAMASIAVGVDQPELKEPPAHAVQFFDSRLSKTVDTLSRSTSMVLNSDAEASFANLSEIWAIIRVQAVIRGFLARLRLAADLQRQKALGQDHRFQRLSAAMEARRVLAAVRVDPERLRQISAASSKWHILKRKIVEFYVRHLYHREDDEDASSSRQISMLSFQDPVDTNTSATQIIDLSHLARDVDSEGNFSSDSEDEENSGTTTTTSHHKSSASFTFSRSDSSRASMWDPNSESTASFLKGKRDVFSRETEELELHMQRIASKEEFEENIV